MAVLAKTGAGPTDAGRLPEEFGCANICRMLETSWAAIMGEWTFDKDSVRYLRPGPALPASGPVFPFGLAQSSQRLRDGKVHTSMTLHTTSGTTGSILIGYQSPRDPYLLVQLGAYEAAYGIAIWQPESGWHSVERAGLAKNLLVDHAYNVTAEIMGQRIRMSVDDVDVLRTVVEAPLVGTSVGLSAWGVTAVDFSGFRLTDVKNPSAFVIMPFTEPFDTLYREVILPVATKCGFEVVRVDEIMAPGIILDDIQRQIAEAHVVVAEISQPNPNVYYELGYAHALHKPAVLLARRDPEKQLPFDVRSYRAIFYDDTIGGKHAVERALTQHLDAVKQQR
jgi:hypothetical protein